MKKKMINQMHLEGLLYEANLELKTSGAASKNPGTEYLTGKISVATDSECLNVVEVNYTYVTATTKNGGENKTYTTLKNIMDGLLKTVMRDGKENATLVRVDTVIGLNEFYSDNRQTGAEEFVSVKRNDGGFIHVTDVLSPLEETRNKFECDMVITGAREVEANEERGYPAKVIIKGAIFDFRNALLPVELTVTNEGGMAYFMGLEPSSSNPIFTKVWGKQISETTVRRIEEESAFGAPSVKEIRSSYKDFIVTGVNPTPYEWDLEETMTNADLQKAVAEREVYLATLKKRREEYKASKAAEVANVAAPAAGSGFKF
jgi:hypothetical protein